MSNIKLNQCPHCQGTHFKEIQLYDETMEINLGKYLLCKDCGWSQSGNCPKCHAYLTFDMGNKECSHDYKHTYVPLTRKKG